jgi:hypothetical protein
MSARDQSAIEWLAENDPRGLALAIEIVDSGLLRLEWDASTDDPVKRRAVVDRAVALMLAAQAVDDALAGFDPEERALVAKLVAWRGEREQDGTMH